MPYTITTTTPIDAVTEFVHQRISLCLFWIKHYLFVLILSLLTFIATVLPFGRNCSAEGFAFIVLTRFTELIGVKPTVTANDVHAEQPAVHFDKMMLLRQKLVKLFDHNLHTCYPTATTKDNHEEVKILPVQLFDKESFRGEEKSFFIRTNNSSIKEGQQGQKITVLYIHGGGFLCGESTTYVNILTPWLHENNFDCLVVDYGLCPSHTPEEIAMQGRRAYDFLEHDMHIDPKHIVVAGESAGANLSIQVVRELVCEGNKLPAGLVLLSPWVDLTLSTNSWRNSGSDVVLTDNLCRLGEKLEIWQDGEESRKYSPLFMDLSHLPPCMVSYGDVERLCDEGVQLCERLRGCGVSVTEDPQKGMFHAFSLFHKYIPEGKMSLDRAAAFIKQHAS
jgi:monoterpene epsilon-lactone hydrolase